MSIEQLDHYTVAVADLEASKRFYTTVLGLEEGPQPAFTFPGAWLYCGGRPTVHLAGGRASGGPGTGRLDHIAFRATGIRAMTDRLDALGIAFTSRTVPNQAVQQVFIKDPDGITIELNFPLDEAK